MIEYYITDEKYFNRLTNIESGDIMDSMLIEKLSKFTSILPSVYKMTPVRKFNKDIMVIKCSNKKYLVCEKLSNEHINKYFIIWCIAIGMPFDSRESVDEYIEFCQKYYDYNNVFEIDFYPSYKSLKIHICTLQKNHDKYCVYMQLNNQEFSDEQLKTAVGFGRRFEIYEDAICCVEKIRDRILEYDRNIDVNIVRDTFII